MEAVGVAGPVHAFVVSADELPVFGPEHAHGHEDFVADEWVADGPAFMQTVESGLRSAKGFGFGLLSVAHVREQAGRPHHNRGVANVDA